MWNWKTLRCGRSQGVVRKLLDVAQFQFAGSVVGEEEPVAPPGDVAFDGAAVDLDRDVSRRSVTRHVADRELARLVELDTDIPHRRFNRVDTRLNAAKMGQRCAKPNSPVSAHVEVADIIEKDDAGGVGRVQRFAQNRANHRVRTARLIDDSGTVVIVSRAEEVEPFGHGARAKRGSALNDDPRRLPAGVAIDDMNFHSVQELRYHFAQWHRCWSCARW